jgi:hypothetical protein
MKGTKKNPSGNGYIESIYNALNPHLTEKKLLLNPIYYNGTQHLQKHLHFNKKGGRKDFHSFALLQEAEHYRAVHYHSNGAVFCATRTSEPSFFNKAQDGKLFGQP